MLHTVTTTAPLCEFYPVAGCTCLRPWHSVTPPPPCPVHGPFHSPLFPYQPVTWSPDLTPTPMRRTRLDGAE
jgi:hypothetical protein